MFVLTMNSLPSAAPLALNRRPQMSGDEWVAVYVTTKSPLASIATEGFVAPAGELEGVWSTLKTPVTALPWLLNFRA